MSLAHELRQADALIRETQKARQDVDRIAATITDALNGLLAQVSAVRAAQLLRAPLIAQELVGRTMRDGQNRLDRIASAFPGTERDLRLVKEHVASLLKGRYTMESERALHAVFNEPEVVSRTAPANATAAPCPASTMDTLNDIFF